MKAWLPVLVVLLLAGCGGPEKTARVTVQQDHLEARNGLIYIEGALQFIEIRHPGEQEPVVLAKVGAKPQELAVAPGTYTVVSYSRVCGGHCQQSLGDPVDRCRKRHVRVDRRTALTVWTMVGEPCAIG